jgi:hypothetical protein
MKRLWIVCLLLLTGCSSVEAPLPAYVPPVQPGPLVVAQGLSGAAGDAKLAGPLESSPIRQAGPLAPGAPGAYVACVRSVAAPQSPYAVFFKDEKPKISRLALYPDHCFDAIFQPFSRVEPPKP